MTQGANEKLNERAGRYRTDRGNSLTIAPEFPLFLGADICGLVLIVATSGTSSFRSGRSPTSEQGTGRRANVRHWQMRLRPLRRKMPDESKTDRPYIGPRECRVKIIHAA